MIITIDQLAGMYRDAMRSASKGTFPAERREGVNTLMQMITDHIGATEGLQMQDILENLSMHPDAT